MAIIEDINKAKQVLTQASRTACFSGAGLSADSGVATFRDSETHALWSRFDPMELASPEGFASNPKRVIDWYNWRREQLANVNPNPGHIALAQQSELIQITQNVDDLLERAGLAEDKILHLHGTITKDHCNQCNHSEAVTLGTPPSYRFCSHCHNGEMRPSVVWFGESLPDATWQAADQLCREIDALLVVGTNASVYPAAGLIQIAKRAGATVIIVNTQASEASHMAEIELIGKSGDILPELLKDISLRSF